MHACVHLPEGCVQQTDEMSTTFHHAELSGTLEKSEKCDNTKLLQNRSSDVGL